MRKGQTVCKIICFILVLIVIFVGLGKVFVQVWETEAYELYDEPDNSIETVFLGSSMMQFNVDTMKLYEDYGMCAYNMGTLGQPVISSYFWLEEVYRLHAETLKTVVFDVTLLRKGADEIPWRLSIDCMEMSPVKYRAIDAYVEDYNDLITYFFPTLSYHHRWSELNCLDFGKQVAVIDLYARGYAALRTTYFDKITLDEVQWPNTELDTSAEVAELNDEAIEYLYKMIDFCDANNLELVLLRAPGPLNWSSSDHNAVVQVLEGKDVEFLDFNFSPLINEIGYDFLLDSYDGIHLNYYGSQKFTKWIGEYLAAKGCVTDVRGNDRYSFLEEQLSVYHRDVVGTAKIRECLDPVDYISLACENENYTIFIMGKDDASNALTENQRKGFEKLGLNKLKELDFQESYLAVIDNGKVVYEETDSIDETNSNLNVSISHQGELRDKSIYSISSGGAQLGNVAECKIEGVQYAINERGINIVIYDNTKSAVVEIAVFDTYRSSIRDVSVEHILEEMLKNTSQEDMTENLLKYVEYVNLSKEINLNSSY